MPLWFRLFPSFTTHLYQESRTPIWSVTQFSIFFFFYFSICLQTCGQINCLYGCIMNCKILSIHSTQSMSKESTWLSFSLSNELNIRSLLIHELNFHRDFWAQWEQFRELLLYHQVYRSFWDTVNCGLSAPGRTSLRIKTSLNLFHTKCWWKEVHHPFQVLQSSWNGACDCTSRLWYVWQRLPSGIFTRCPCVFNFLFFGFSIHLTIET